MQNQYRLLPVGGQYSLGLVVTGQPVDPALNENQAELGILVLCEQKTKCFEVLEFTFASINANLNNWLC